MRVTSSSYYRDISANNNKLADKLFDVNKQISSGQKIQYAYEDTSTFVDTLRLDNEITTLQQVKASTQSGYKFSTQSDNILTEMTTSLEHFKTKLISAANAANSDTSLDAIAKELRATKEYMVDLANTSINGQYLFSGSAVKTKPIDNDGNYNGNDQAMKAFLGSNVQKQYNIPGSDLFLGEENTINRTVTTNIAMNVNGTVLPANGSNTLEDITGTTNDQNFYVRGSNSDGTTFKSLFTLPSNTTVDNLLQSIQNQFTPNSVDVTLNEGGQIVITDKKSGSSKLDFHIVAGDDAVAPTDIDTISTSIEFMKSGLTANSVATGSESAIYDRTFFDRDGANLTSNVSQIVKADNAFAVDATKLDDVFASLGSTVHVEGKRLDGTVFNIDVDFGTPAAVSGDYNYNVADGAGNDTNGADMTYRQFMDVINMAINNQTPADNDAGYRTAITNSNLSSSVALSHDGKITFTDFNNNPTQADISIYDDNSDDFSNTNGAAATFHTNNTLTVRDAKTDFFARIEEMIVAVENKKLYADGNKGDARNVGIENSIQLIDDVYDHVVRQHTQIGANSNALTLAGERTDLLLISTQTLRSDVIDTDLAEASLQLQQLTVNYQAMLSTVGRVSQLTLVNYL